MIETDRMSMGYPIRCCRDDSRFSLPPSSILKFDAREPHHRILIVSTSFYITIYISLHARYTGCRYITLSFDINAHLLYIIVHNITLYIADKTEKIHSLFWRRDALCKSPRSWLRMRARWRRLSIVLPSCDIDAIARAFWFQKISRSVKSCKRYVFIAWDIRILYIYMHKRLILLKCEN